jgi:hypothetical protein
MRDAAFVPSPQHRDALNVSGVEHGYVSPAGREYLQIGTLVRSGFLPGGE